MKKNSGFVLVYQEKTRNINNKCRKLNNFYQSNKNSMEKVSTIPWGVKMLIEDAIQMESYYNNKGELDEFKTYIKCYTIDYDIYLILKSLYSRLIK